MRASVIVLFAFRAACGCIVGCGGDDSGGNGTAGGVGGTSMPDGSATAGSSASGGWMGSGGSGGSAGTGGVGGSGCTDAGVVSADAGSAGKTSFEKIDDAFKRCVISEEVAITYKFFATFKDPRLPAEYQGDDSDVIDSDAFDWAYARWSALSDRTKEIIEPFLVPPAYKGSWASAAPATVGGVRPQTIGIPICRQPTYDLNWAAKPADQNGRVKVWYDTRVAGANTQADEVLAALETKIWPTLVDMVGLKGPLSDAAITGCNGGDGRLDVYLVDMATHGQTATDLGETFPVQLATKQYPAFILLNRSLAPDELKGSAAHEFAHASQWAYPVAAFGLSSYKWLKEATAQWAIDAVYPNLPDPKGIAAQFEQRKAPAFMDTPDESLESEQKGADRVYGSYLFFQFLARTLMPSVIASVWNATTSESNQVLAVDKGIPGGFKEQWPKFAKLLWNQDPVNTNSFEGWDSLMTTPKVRGDAILEVNLRGAPGATQRLNGNIAHLASHYYHLRISDPNVRSFLFLNHPFATIKTAGFNVTTQAFFKKEGGIWQYEHWSDEGLKEATKSFCLDITAERIQELVIVMSNDDPKADVTMIPDGSEPRISVSNVGCWRFKGTTSVTDKVTDISGRTSNSTADATITFERWRPAQMPDGAAGRETFQVESGAVIGSLVQTMAPCTLTSNGAGPMPAGLASGTLLVDLGVDYGPTTLSREVSGSGGSEAQTHTEYVCDMAPPTITDGISSWSWMEFPSEMEMKVEVKADGTIQGNYTSTYMAPFSGTKTMIWNLVPQRQ